jgi:hypothetical protein
MIEDGPFEQAKVRAELRGKPRITRRCGRFKTLHEDVITSKLVDELERFRYAWKIEPQNPQTFIDSTRRPDFIIKTDGNRRGQN